MGKGTSWQLVLRSWHTIPRPPREVSCGQNLPAGKDLAGTKEAFCWWWGSFFGRKDRRRPWGVISGPSTGRDGTRDWDGIERHERTEVAYRLPAKPGC